MKVKTCEICKKKGPLWSAKYKACKDCYFRHKSKLTDSKPRAKNISPVSNKMLKNLALYRTARRTFLQDNPVCQAGFSGCTYTATDVHHAKGRGIYLLDTRYFRALCRSCHTVVELNPQLAKKLKLSQNRLNNDDE